MKKNDQISQWKRLITINFEKNVAFLRSNFEDNAIDIDEMYFLHLIDWNYNKNL
jgi:hypothetical protein